MLDPILDRVAGRADVERVALSAAYNGGTRGPNGFVTARIYDRGRPLVVCRFARSCDRLTRREWAKDRLVDRLVRGTPYLAGRVPTPLALERVAGRPVLFAEFLRGDAAYDAFSRFDATATAFLRNATEWLVRFAEATRDRRVYDRGRKWDALAGRVRDTSLDPVRRFASSDDLFLGPTHGDFDGTNVLVDDGEIRGVLDFEYFDTAGVPLTDFAKLAVETGRHVFGDFGTALDRAFFRDCRFSRAVAANLTRYCDRLGMDRTDATACLGLYPALRLGTDPEDDLAPDVRAKYRAMERRLADADAAWA